MTRAQNLTRHAVAVLIDCFAYAVALLGFSEFACAIRWFVECSHPPLEGLHLIILMLAVVGLIVHTTAMPFVLLLRRLNFNRIWFVVAIYTVFGYLLPQLWMMLTSESRLLQPSRLDAPFFYRLVSESQLFQVASITAHDYRRP